MPQFIENGIRYENLNENFVTVLGFGFNCECPGIVIPEKIRGYTVIAIKDKAFEYTKILREVFLPKTIAKIGKRAFMNCFDLETVHIDGAKNDLTIEIDEKAFKECVRFQTLDCLRKISLIGSSVFYGCKTLNNIFVTFINNIPEQSFKSCISLTFFIFEEQVTIDDSAFDNCLSLKNLEFRADVITTPEFFLRNKKCTIFCFETSQIVNLAFEGYRIKIIEDVV